MLKLSILLCLSLCLNCTQQDLEGIDNIRCALIILLLLTPVGWGIMILSVIGIIVALNKGVNKLCETDYTPVKNKKEQLLSALSKEKEEDDIDFLIKDILDDDYEEDEVVVKPKRKRRKSL